MEIKIIDEREREFLTKKTKEQILNLAQRVADKAAKDLFIDRVYVMQQEAGEEALREKIRRQSETPLERTLKQFLER